jgi:hypothetical protein
MSDINFMPLAQAALSGVAANLSAQARAGGGFPGVAMQPQADPILDVSNSSKGNLSIANDKGDSVLDVGFRSATVHLDDGSKLHITRDMDVLHESPDGHVSRNGDNIADGSTLAFTSGGQDYEISAKATDDLRPWMEGLQLNRLDDCGKAVETLDVKTRDWGHHASAEKPAEACGSQAADAGYEILPAADNDQSDPADVDYDTMMQLGMATALLGMAGQLLEQAMDGVEAGNCGISSCFDWLSGDSQGVDQNMVSLMAMMALLPQMMSFQGVNANS